MQGSIGPCCYCFTIATRKEVEHKNTVHARCSVTVILQHVCLPHVCPAWHFHVLDLEGRGAGGRGLFFAFGRQAVAVVRRMH